MSAVSRRTFLKGAAAAGAAVALSGAAAQGYFAPGAAVKADAAPVEEWKPATCPGCHNPICGTQAVSYTHLTLPTTSRV